MTMEPLALEPLTADQVVLATRVVGRGRRGTVQLGQDVFTVAFVTKPAAWAFQQAIKVRVGQTIAWIGVTGLDRCRSFCQLLGDVRLSELPSEVQAAVIEAFFEPILDRLEGKWGEALEIVEITTETPPQALNLQLDFVLMQGRNTVIHGRLAFPQPLLEAVVALAERMESTGCNDLGEVPVRGRVEIGFSKLPIGELRNLAPRDVVLMDATTLDAASLDAKGKVRLRFAPSLVCEARLDESGLTIDEIDLSPPPPSKEEDSDVIGGSMNDLDIDLAFSLGETYLPLRELTLISPGKTLRFPQEHLQPCIRASDRRLACGELVSVGSRVGLRLVRFQAEETPLGKPRESDLSPQPSLSAEPDSPEWHNSIDPESFCQSKNTDLTDDGAREGNCDVL